MKRIINPVTASIIERVEDGDTIRAVAKKTGFAYSAVYKWVEELESAGVLGLEKKGNKTVISVNREPIYGKFMELFSALDSAEKNNKFWGLMERTMCRVRFTGNTAAVLWTRGGYITGDFYDRIYHIDVLENDCRKFESELERIGLEFAAEGKIPSSEKRPFVNIGVVDSIKVKRINGVPVLPLRELILWCRKLGLDPILEQLDLIHKLGLRERHSELYAYG